MRTCEAVGGAAKSVPDGAVDERPRCAAIRRRTPRRRAAVGGAAARLDVRHSTAAQACTHVEDVSDKLAGSYGAGRIAS